jgi:UDP-N-acetylmuramoyl-L-alanyl-D-glutamate--2,6-diaminopimelate ligase
MGLAAEEGADRVIVTSDNPRGESVEDIARDIFRGAGESPKHELVHDRGAAIRRAISEASSEDIVLIAGKGHENYQVIDGKRSPFSDVDVARRILAETFK